MTNGRAPQQGDEIGPYRLEEVIGVGGMGIVHAATDHRLGRRVALKVLLAHSSSPAFRERFQREAAVLARLDSPHVLAVFDHGEHEGHPFIAMQLAAGGDLGRLLRARGALPPALGARVCAQVADALVAAHGVGVIHRDVKPANVLLRDADPGRLDRLHAYLSDFGVALTDTGGLTAAGTIAGTWSYLAPERTRGEHGAPASDVYAVGCLFHEVLTGRPPYSGSDVEVAMQHVSSPVPRLPGTDETTMRVNQVLARSMAKDPADRYPSAADLRDHLRELAGTLPGAPATPVPVIATSPSRRRGRRRLVAVAAVATLVVGGVAAAVALVGGPGEDPPGPDPTSAAPTPDPTASAPTDAPPAPAAEPVIGDLDGDGLGDVAWADFDRTTVVRSTGTGWKAPARRPIGGPDVLLGDVDGDATSDLVSIEGSAPTIVVGVRLGGSRGGGEVVSSPLDVPVQRGQLDPDHLLADVDGDGRDDVVVAYPRGSSETELLVAIARDDATFEPTRRWYRGELNPVESYWAVGDLDGDGDDDLVLGSGNDLADQRTTFRLVRSTGSSFELAGSVVGTDTQSDEYVSLDEYAVGDVDGDGAADLVAFGSYTGDASVWRWIPGRGRWLRGGVWAANSGIDGDDRAADGLYGTLSDVDGDGRADLVTLGLEGVRVLLSTGTSFRFSPDFRLRQDVDDGDLVDRVALGIY